MEWDLNYTFLLSYFISCIKLPFTYILLNLHMIDRALGFSAPESYYFQLYPVNLILLQQPVPSSESKFKFSIYKGMQKFDQNKIMTDANFINTNGVNVMPFRGCQLNFYLPNFNKMRKILFTLKLNEKDSNQEYELGGIDIDPAVFINQFQNNGQTRFQQKVEISQQYALEFEVYLQKSRFALQKVVKSFQGERAIKSPVRQRKSPVVQRGSNLKEEKSPVKEAQPVIEELQSVTKSSTKNRSRVQESIVQKEERQSPVKEQASEKVVEKSFQKPKAAKKDLQVPQNTETKQKSEKSENLVSPLVRSKQMKRTLGKNELTIQSSQRLIKEAEQVIEAKKVDADSWTNHLQLVVFTVVGILAIYWVMHPTNRA